MNLYPQIMGLNGEEAGKIAMEDGSRTLLESSGGLLLLAKEGIRLESMTGIAVQGVSDIMALCGAGTSSLCVNGSVDMTGGLTGLGGSTYRHYAPYADAPEEGEFDWGGFARNLAIGLGVVAVCAIGAAISIATFGAGSILAGAFIGAGMGAISATVAGAAGDYSSGNVRSTEEAIRDVAIAAISGAITGAVGVKFPGMNRLVEGGVDTAVATAERAAYAALDGDMTLEEKLAYIFDPGQMAVDFVTGVFIGEMLDGMMAGIQNKLRSIFANNDAAMREALGIGDDSIKGASATQGYSNFADGMSTEDAARYIANNEKAFFNEFSERASAAGLSDTQIAEAFEAMRTGDYVKMATYFDTSSPVDGAVFWSGNKEGAAAYATNIGGTIMEQTSGGQVFDNWRGLGGMYPEWDTSTNLAQKPIWDALSSQYANGAEGIATYAHPDGYVGKVWSNIEKPILEENDIIIQEVIIDAK